MKSITLLAMAVSLMIDLFGTTSSVGGPMTLLLVAFVTMLAVGVYEAVANDRGPFGWIVSLVVALVGGLVGIWLFSVALETAMSLIQFEGRLATSQHPLRYVASAAVPLFTILGAWLALQAVNRLRPKRDERRGDPVAG